MIIPLRSIWLIQAAAILALTSTTAFAQQVLFSVGNSNAVSNGAVSPEFKLKRDAVITQIQTYHWNNGQGVIPGLIGLHRKNSSYTQWFPAFGTAGTGGAFNVNWVANVNINLTAGYYYILDSDLNTWSSNATTHYRGFSSITGTYLAGAPPPPAPSSSAPFGGNCQGFGCFHPDLSAFGGNGPFGGGIPSVSVHLAHNPQNYFWIAELPPFTSVFTLQQQCNQTSSGSGLTLLDDEPWYYYFVGNYARFGCRR